MLIDVNGPVILIIIPYVATWNGEIRAREWKNDMAGDLRRYEGRLLGGQRHTTNNVLDGRRWRISFWTSTKGMDEFEDNQ